MKHITYIYREPSKPRSYPVHLPLSPPDEPLPDEDELLEPFDDEEEEEEGE